MSSACQAACEKSGAVYAILWQPEGDVLKAKAHYKYKDPDGPMIAYYRLTDLVRMRDPRRVFLGPLRLELYLRSRLRRGRVDVKAEGRIWRPLVVLPVES